MALRTRTMIDPAALAELCRAKIFTTGMAATIFGVAPRTVSKWFDSGMLKGFRIPGSQDRRIPRGVMVQFARDYNLPNLELFQVRRNVAVVGCSAAAAESLAASLPSIDWRVEVFGSVFKSGAFITTHRMTAVVIAMNIGRAAVAEVIEHSPEGTRFIVIAGEYATGPELAEVESLGCVRVLREPFDASELAVMIANGAGED